MMSKCEFIVTGGNIMGGSMIITPNGGLDFFTNDILHFGREQVIYIKLLDRIYSLSVYNGELHYIERSKPPRYGWNEQNIK